MATYNGTTIVLDADDNPLAQITESTLSMEQDLPDASNKDSAGYAEHINGQKSWSISFDSHADFTDNADTEKIARDWQSGAQITVIFESEVASELGFKGTASVDSFEISAPNEDVVTASGSFTGTGKLTIFTTS